MGWKKLAIIFLIIFVNTGAKPNNKQLNEEIFCSAKRILCLDEISFKFCFSSGSKTYLYGQVKNCPHGTICNEYEGSNACMENHNESVNIHNVTPIEDSTYSTIPYETTITLPPIRTITVGQITETMITKLLSTTINHMMQSTDPSELSETNSPVDDAHPSLSTNGIISSTVMASSEASSSSENFESSTVAMNSPVTDTHQSTNILDTSTVSSTFNLLPELLTYSSTSRYTTDYYSMYFTKPSATTESLVLERTTPSSTTIHGHPSKVTKRKRKSTTKKLKKRRKKTTPSTNTSNSITIPSKITSSHMKPQSNTTRLSSEPTNRIPSTLPTTMYIKTSEIPIVPSTLLTSNYVTVDRSISTKNQDSSTTSTSTRIAIVNTTTTLFPCQNFLLKLLKGTTSVTESALPKPIKTALDQIYGTTNVTVNNLHENEVQDSTPPSICRTTGKYPSKNCNEYYECLKVMWWYRLMFRKCRKQERFDHGTLTCIPDSTCI